MTPRADPRGDLTVGLTAPSPTDLGLLLAGVADARGRILPTLPSSPALAALDTQLGRLEAALSTGELPTAGSAVDQARSALGDLAGAGEVAPAEVGAIELALDRVMRVVRPSAP